jgi:[ribosomal protein S5]-alanine N-acetyltransferase
MVHWSAASGWVSSGPMRPLRHPLFTERLRLEPVTPELAEAARSGAAAFETRLGADAPADWRRASLPLMANAAHPAWGPATPIRAVAVHRTEGVVVGDVRFEPSLRAPNEVEIGYSVALTRRRQGYAVETTGAMIDWLFAHGGVETVIAGCDKSNTASIATLRRLGFWLDSNPGTAFWWLMTPELRAEVLGG